MRSTFFRMPLLHTARLFLCTLLLTSCLTFSSINPQYRPQLKRAWKNGTGSEIVGIWTGETQTRINRSTLPAERHILMLKPDGHGRWRRSNIDGSTGGALEQHVLWSYEGNGLWTVSSTNKVGSAGPGQPVTDYLTSRSFAGKKYTVRFTGSSLLLEEEPRSFKVKWVFAPIKN